VSFDVYLMAFNAGVPADIPRERVREAFGPFVTEAQCGLTIVGGVREARRSFRSRGGSWIRALGEQSPPR